jgi:hypothetical protein
LLLSERHTKTELIGFGIILIGVITVIKGQWNLNCNLKTRDI